MSLFKNHPAVKNLAEACLDEYGGYRSGDVLRRDDGEWRDELLVVTRVFNKGTRKWGLGEVEDWTWVVCVDAEGRTQPEPTKEQAARWKANFIKNGQGPKPLPTYPHMVAAWNHTFEMWPAHDKFRIPVPSYVALRLPPRARARTHVRDPHPHERGRQGFGSAVLRLTCLSLGAGDTDCAHNHTRRRIPMHRAVSNRRALSTQGGSGRGSRRTGSSGIDLSRK